MESNEDCDTCWICLEGVEGADAQPGPLHANRLIKPCRCPRVVHSVCLAKWQLSQSGRSEEKFCRFCKDRLPEWQANLALPGMGAVEPVMSVHFNGQTHMVKVKPGEEGRVAFIQDVRRLLRLRDNQEFSITFECKVPGHGMFLDLKGLSSYDAAVFCAAMTAVERQRLAAQKAHKSGASGLLRGSGTSLSSSCFSAPAAPSLAATGGGTATTSSVSSVSSSNNNRRNSGGATSSSTSTTSLSSTSYTLPPVVTSSSSRTRTGASSSSAGASETDGDAMSISPTRSRTASISSAHLSAAATAPTPGRGGGQGGPSAGPAHAGAGDPASGPAGESILLPSSSSGPARSLLPAWPLPLHNSALVGQNRSSHWRGAAAAEAESMTDRQAAQPDAARNISGPLAHPGATARGTRAPTAGAGWGSSAYDSACDVEPEGAAAGEAAAAGASAGAAGASSGAAGGVDVRPKSARQLRQGVAPGGRLPALSEHPRRGQCSSNATWLSRLLFCASFGGGQGAATR